MEACTIAALDVITAFAVPNPNCSFAESVGFFRSGRSPSYPIKRITQLTSDWQILLSQPFQPSTGVKLNSSVKDVNAVFARIMRFL